MFKKIFLSLVILLAAFTLAACKKRTFVADGEYTAFKYELHHDTDPMITSVTVTIEDDEIVDFYIDCVQSTKVVEGEATKFPFNAKSKKQLGFEYKMHWSGYAASVTEGEPTLAGYQTWLTANGKLEWHQQAALIEDKMVADGVESVTVGEGDVINGVSGVTIKDGSYTELAAKAVQNAKDGKVQAFLPVNSKNNANIVWATATVNKKGKLSNIVIDTVQGSATADAYTWDAKTKQQKGFEYKMHWSGYAASVTEGEPTLAGYQAWLSSNGKLEWFQQANLIAEFVEENGINALTIVDGEMTNLSSVTVTTGDYVTVLQALFDKVA